MKFRSRSVIGKNRTRDGAIMKLYLQNRQPRKMSGQIFESIQHKN